MRRVHLALVALIVVLAALTGQLLWGDQIMWGTFADDHIIWGTLGGGGDQIIWGD